MEEIIFPNKIRLLRQMAGKSMQDLADELGISLSAISKIEKGYRKIDQKQMLIVSKFLGCSISDIFVSEENDDEIVLEAWRKEISKRVQINQNNGLKIFGAGLRYLRTKQNLTLIEIAERADLTLSVYHRIEVGQREVFETELIAIARALGMNVKDILTKIFELNKNGSLNKFMDSEVTNVNSISKMTDILRATENVYTSSGVVKFNKVLISSKTLENGNMLVDKSDRDFTLYPMSDQNVNNIYALELVSRRLGPLIPIRSVLFIDSSKSVKSGDIAAQVITSKDGNFEVRLLSVREDMDGTFYGVMYNPDEKIKLSQSDLSSLQKVVLVSMI